MSQVIEQPAGYSLALPAALWAGFCGAATFNLAPLFLPAAMRAYQLDDRQIGLLMGLEIGGLALASLLALLLAPRIGVAWLARLGCAGMIIGNGVSALAADPAQLMALRFMTGLLGNGLAYSAAIMALGARANPTGAFALLGLNNMCLSALVLAVLPHLDATPDWTQTTGTLAVVALPGLLLARWIDTGQPPGTRTAKPAKAISATGLLALFCLMAFTLNIGAVWTYLERIGNAVGLAETTVGTFLSVSLVCQAAGSVTAALLSLRCNRTAVLHVAYVMQITGLCLLATANTSLPYLLAVSIWGFSWNLGIANLLGSIATLPVGQRLLPLVPGTEAIGASLGPVIVALLLADDHYLAVSAVGGCAMVTSFLTLQAIRRRATRAA